MTAVPAPGRLKHGLQALKTGPPAQFPFYFSRPGHHRRRVPGPPRRVAYRDGPARHCFGGPDYLQDGIAVSVPQVVDCGRSPRSQRRQGQDLGGGQVVDVEVGPDAGTVRGGVVGARSIQVGRRPRGRREDKRGGGVVWRLLRVLCSVCRRTAATVASVCGCRGPYRPTIAAGSS